MITFMSCYSPLSSRLTARDSKWVAVAFYSMQWISTELVHIQRCLVVTWLVPLVISACSVYTVQSCTMSCHFMQSQIRRVYVWLAVTCHLHFWQNDLDLLWATAITRGWNGYWNKSAQKVDPGEENPPATPAGIKTRDLLITSPAL